jgi:hypothetical protein
MAEVAISRHLLGDILRLIAELQQPRRKPPMAQLPFMESKLGYHFSTLPSLRCFAAAGDGMTVQSSGNEAANAIGDPFAVIFAGFVPEGPLRTLVVVVECLCAILAPYRKTTSK